MTNINLKQKAVLLLHIFQNNQRFFYYYYNTNQTTHLYISQLKLSPVLDIEPQLPRLQTVSLHLEPTVFNELTRQRPAIN